jgi:hypothetical protein
MGRSRGGLTCKIHVRVDTQWVRALDFTSFPTSRTYAQGAP